MKSFRIFIFLISFFSILTAGATETVITPNFSVGSLKGISYNSSSTTRTFFVVDTSKLYIANSSWQLRNSYTIASGLSDVTYQNSTKSAYMVTQGGKVYEFNTDKRRIVSTMNIPLQDSSGNEIVDFTNDKFVGITKAGSYFYLITTHKILQVSLQTNRLKKTLVLKNYWESSLNFSGVDYNSSENKLYFSDDGQVNLIDLSILTSHASGSNLDSSLFENYLTPSTGTEGLCVSGENLIFAENTPRLIQEPMDMLFSDERQDELAGVTSGPGDGNGIPFGFWGMNGYISTDGFADTQNRFGVTIFQVASSSPGYTVNTLLPLVRASGMRVTLRMTADHSTYTTDGNFDLAKWKEALSVWVDSGVQEFIDDGTLAGHMILDDIDTFSGIDATASDLDEMARYSQEIMPGLMTFARQKATRMPVPASGYYDYLDACVNQYTNYQGYSDGDINIYATIQHDTAMALGLEIINGLNIADGGDGSSGQPGWKSGKYAMSADEIMSYGEVLLSVPDVTMFLMWEYDGEESWSDGSIGADYFDQPDMQDAIYYLSQIAAEY